MAFTPLQRQGVYYLTALKKFLPFPSLQFQIYVGMIDISIFFSMFSEILHEVIF